jgi:hypothetical protein
MQYDQHLSAKTETCQNRFELSCRFGEPIDWEWAHAQLKAWLRNRVDGQSASVYDGGIPSRGVENDQPQA